MNALRFFILSLISLLAPSGFAHPGGLDSSGGHFNRKTGEYHYHRAPSSSSSSRSTGVAPSRQEPAPSPASAPVLIPTPSSIPKERPSEAKPLSDEVLQRLMKKAAEGHVSAQYELGDRYAKGDGVEKNLEKAKKWLSQAAAQGDIFAKRRLQSLTNTSTSPLPAIASPAPAPKSESISDAPKVVREERKFWITNSTGKRHNSGCRYYGNSQGHFGGAGEGVACKICGG